jgi:glutathione S-transferase
MKLYSGPLSMFSAKVQIALHEKGIEFELIMVPFSFKTRYEPKHSEVVRVNPKQQIPILIDGDIELFDSTQIFEYLEDRKPTPALWPSEIKRRARARQLELMSDEVFFPHVVKLMSRARSGEPTKMDAAETTAILAYYERMEKVLAGQDYLAGDFSYADIALYMAHYFALFLGAPTPSECVRLNDWQRRVGDRESVQRVILPMKEYLYTNRSRDA